MSMTIIECDQGSEEWFAARRGVLTASNFKKVLDTRGNPSKQCQDYIDELVGEAITGESHKGNFGDSGSYWMDRGTELESEAREFYIKNFLGSTLLDVEQVGFCLLDGQFIGCSPDALLGEFGGLEIKCPSAKVHNKYLREGRLPPAYYQQVMGSLLVTGRKWWDFMSYHPSYKKQVIVRVFRNEEYLSKMLEHLTIAAEKIQNDIKKYT